jgi:hypothetical protein
MVHHNTTIEVAASFNKRKHHQQFIYEALTLNELGYFNVRHASVSNNNIFFWFSPPVYFDSEASYSIKWFQPPLDRNCGGFNRDPLY